MYKFRSYKVQNKNHFSYNLYDKRAVLGTYFNIPMIKNNQDHQLYLKENTRNVKFKMV